VQDDYGVVDTYLIKNLTRVTSDVQEFLIRSNIKHRSLLLASFQCCVTVDLTRNLSSGKPIIDLAQ
jgi:hypothetical protein